MARTRLVALDHISVPVRGFVRARKFYEAALGSIGMKVNMEMGDAVGLGSKNEKVFWLVKDRKASGGGHYALRVDDRRDVDAFHAAAMKAGGADHGAPGPRPDYGPNYYAAFVYDPEGNNIEVVCYAAHAAKKRAVQRKARNARSH